MIGVGTRRLGSQGLVTSAQGLGCLGMGGAYGPVDETEAVATIHRAIELGVTLLDMADVYGPYVVEKLVGRAVAGRRDQVVIATKFGSRCRPDGTWLGLDSRPEYLRQAVQASLTRLGVEHIDLYYQHRVDPDVAIEETWGALADLVHQGLVGYLGLCEAAPSTIRKAHAVHPVTAIQSEYSLFSREPEAEVLATVRELGIGFVAYCPLGRGLLTGTLSPDDRFEPGDSRHASPRFEGVNLEQNLVRAGQVADLARRSGISPAQLALAWLSSRGDDVVAIPGSITRLFLEENADAVSVHLDDGILAELDRLAPPGAAAGARFAPALAATLNR
ncbi:MAG TPA: aldo/keto reductase [Acidimicrobiales bacterium]|nr:aldo/keto reductase [Acidimicrobiales bacterium]